MQSPLTNKITVNFNVTLFEASWPATLIAASNFAFGKGNSAQLSLLFYLDYVVAIFMLVLSMTL